MSIFSMLRAQYSFSQWVLVFFLYSFAGWCWEVLLYLIKERRLINRGFLAGPFLPVYGFGALGMLCACLPVKESVGKVAIVGALAASALEYAAGALTLRITGKRYWDYRAQRMNISGHVCLMAALTWAAFAVAVVCVLHPLFQPSVSRMPSQTAGAAAWMLGLLSLWDAAGKIRMRRHKAAPQA